MWRRLLRCFVANEEKGICPGFFCLLAVMRSQAAAVAPIIIPSLSGVWVDGCADLSVPCSSLTVRTGFCHSSLHLHTAVWAHSNGRGRRALNDFDIFPKFLQATIHRAPDSAKTKQYRKHYHRSFILLELDFYFKKFTCLVFFPLMKYYIVYHLYF